MKFSEQFWFPGGVLLLCAAGVQLWTPALAAAQPYLGVVCLLALAAGVVLGWMYTQRRILAALVAIGAAAWLPPVQAAALRSLPRTDVSAAFGATAVLLTALFLWRRRPTDRGLFWSLAAAFAGIHVAYDARLSLLYFGAGAIILAVSLVEHAHAMAYIDTLTGLASRRALDEALAQLRGRFTLGMVDVDHFKRLNDAYGHAAGDQVLRKVAAQLATVGGGGRVFRYGGEEFAVVFTGRSRKEALPHLEALRARIEATGFSLRGSLRPARKPTERRASPRSGRKLHVTVSIGVAELSEKLASPELVIEAADKALYRAKEGGRNQVWAA